MVIGFCESCGRQQDAERGGSLRPTTLSGTYVCDSCYRDAVAGRQSDRPVADGTGGAADPSTSLSLTPARETGLPVPAPARTAMVPARAGITRPGSMGGARPDRRAVFVGLACLAMAGILAVRLSAGLSGAGGAGAVLGVTQPAPSTGGAGAAAASQSAGSAAASAGSAVASTTPTSPGEDVAVSVETAVGTPWKGAFGETRIQVIAAVRNAGAGWVAFPSAASRYRLLDGGGREIGSGVFTAALPGVVRPGGTAYLVDTISAAFATGKGPTKVETEVHAVRAQAATATLTVDALHASTGDDGGLRVTGTVRNDGDVATGPVVAAAIVLDAKQKPLGAVYDLSDAGPLDPHASYTFATSYPGAPPPPPDATVVGVAWESSAAASR
jgi:hypothetical protein